MALPVLEKSWQFNVNQVMLENGTSAAQAQQIMRRVKNTFIGFASNPWTVRGSSNGTVGAMDGVDRWVADSDLTWVLSGGTAHSWIVLRQTGIASNYELCIDLIGNTNGMAAGRYISPSAGFTGGSNTTRPTATDEIVLPATGTSWGPTLATGVSYVLHAMQSTDGQCTLMFLMANYLVLAVIYFARPKNPVTGWTNPSVGMWECENANNGGAQSDCADASIFQTTTTVLRGRGSAQMDVFLTSEGYSGGLNSLLAEYFAGPNEFTGEYVVHPIGFGSNTPGHRGRHGQLFDLWTGPVSPVTTGYTYPANDTSRQFAQFGIFVVPWNGSVVVTG